MNGTGKGIPRGGRFRGASWVCGFQLLAAVLVGILSGIGSWTGVAGAEIAPAAPPPAFTVIPGDRFVRVSWPRQADSLLTAVAFTDPALPEWTSDGVVTLTGTYSGTCDQDYRLEVRRGPLPDSLAVEWTEIPLTPTSLSGIVGVSAADRPVLFSGGLSFSLSSTQIFSLDPADTLRVTWGAGASADSFLAAGNWSAASAAPVSNGLFLRPTTGVFVFTAMKTMILSAAATDTLPLAWIFVEATADTAVTRSGTVRIARPDAMVKVAFDSSGVSRTLMRVGFTEGPVDSAESFAVHVDPTASGGDRVTVGARTFQGYSIWRSEVLDLEQPVFLGRIKHCGGIPDSLSFFDRPVLEYIDSEVHNGFPYYYAVTVADAATDSIPEDVWLSLRQKVYPVQIEYNEDYTSGGSPFRSAKNAHAVPNPYKVSAEWEEGLPKIQFVNLPPRSTVRVYTAAGDLVAVLPQEDPMSDRVSWDTKSDRGGEVVSGIYIFHVESPYGEKTGRFVIIR